MSTYQAASGAGAEGMAELENGLLVFGHDGPTIPHLNHGGFEFGVNIPALRFNIQVFIDFW